MARPEFKAPAPSPAQEEFIEAPARSSPTPPYGSLAVPTAPAAPAASTTPAMSVFVNPSIFEPPPPGNGFAWLAEVADPPVSVEPGSAAPHLPPKPEPGPAVPEPAQEPTVRVALDAIMPPQPAAVPVLPPAIPVIERQLAPPPVLRRAIVEEPRLISPAAAPVILVPEPSPPGPAPAPVLLGRVRPVEARLTVSAQPEVIRPVVLRDRPRPSPARAPAKVGPSRRSFAAWLLAGLVLGAAGGFAGATYAVPRLFPGANLRPVETDAMALAPIRALPAPAATPAPELIDIEARTDEPVAPGSRSVNVVGIAKGKVQAVVIGVVAEVDEKGRFTATVPVKLGQNRIAVAAIPAGGTGKALALPPVEVSAPPPTAVAPRPGKQPRPKSEWMQGGAP